MKLILFGGRGGFTLGASEDSPFQRYGGDTTAFGVLAGDELIAVDAGSAFYKWNYTLSDVLGRQGPQKMHVLWTHYHKDHTSGIILSRQLFAEGNEFEFYGPLSQDTNIEEVFKKSAKEPDYPDLIKAYFARIAFNNLANGKGSLDLPNGIVVKHMQLPHGKITSTAYKITQGDQSVCIVSDAHHEVDREGRPILNPELVEFLNGVQVFVYDCQFTDEEYAADLAKCQKFGHSTGEHGVRLCQAAGVPVLVKHHHSPELTDGEMDVQVMRLKDYAQGTGVEVIASKPSLCLDLDLPPAEMVAAVLAQKTPAQRYAAIRGEQPSPR